MDKPGKGKMGLLLLGGGEDSEEEAPASERGSDEGSDTAQEALDMASEELIDAVSSKDKKAVGEALRSAFAACRK